MNTKENKLICGNVPQLIRETYWGTGKITPPTITEGKKRDGLWTAKIAQADKKNQNNRIYPREVWKDNIERLKPMLPEGRLTGAVDHLDYFAGGNLGDTCIIWRDLWMEDDGAIMGRFEIIEKHSSGADLKAQIEAGMAVGFSTYGYGTGHEPSESERKRYGLSENEFAAIMDLNYSCTKVDGVDQPSVDDAWLARESRHDSAVKQERESEFDDNVLEMASRKVAAYFKESSKQGSRLHPFLVGDEQELADAMAVLRDYAAAQRASS